MPSNDAQADWNGSKLTVKSSLLSKTLWQTATIDVFLEDRCILTTGGRLKLTGAHNVQFEDANGIHDLTLKWGIAGLRSVPVTLYIDGQTVLSARVFNRNWILAYWPLTIALAIALYRVFRR